MSKLNKKSVVIAVACLLLLLPATVAQSQSPQIRASAVCQQGRIVGISMQVLQPGNYSLMFSDDICTGTSRGTVT